MRNLSVLTICIFTLAACSKGPAPDPSPDVDDFPQEGLRYTVPNNDGVAMQAVSDYFRSKFITTRMIETEKQRIIVTRYIRRQNDDSDTKRKSRDAIAIKFDRIDEEKPCIEVLLTTRRQSRGIHEEIWSDDYDDGKGDDIKSIADILGKIRCDHVNNEKTK